MSNANNSGNGSKRKQLMLLALFTFLAAAAIALFYLYLSQDRVYVEDSYITANEINLSSTTGGKLQKLFVSAGDSVSANQVIAQVGNDLVKTKDSGMVISTNNEIGKNFSPNETVATMIRPQDLRVDAKVEEDKGLSDIKVGQEVTFTVDAFGSKKFAGIVDEISPTPRSGDVVFNISDARQEQEFDVKIRFDVYNYPEIKNGMSAKVWIYKD